MNNTVQVDTQAISDIVLNAQQAIADLLTPLLDSDVENSSDFNTARADILVQFENIGMIADMTGLNGLTTVCAQFVNELTEQPINHKQDALNFQSHLDIYLLNILGYLGDWKNVENIEQLVSSLPGDKDSVRQQLLQDIYSTDTEKNVFPPSFSSDPDELENQEFYHANNIHENLIVNSASDNDNDNDSNSDNILDFEIDDLFAEDINDTASASNLDSAEGIMALYCHELHDLQPQFAELAQQILSKGITAETQQHAIRQYQDYVNRIYNSCDDLGLSGLVQICKFILLNLELILKLNITSKTDTVSVLSHWPQVVIDHLQSPADNSLCLALVNYLELEAWPTPLKYNEQRDLIDGLTKQLEITGDYAVEARKTEAVAEDLALDIAPDTSQQLLDAFFTETPGYAEDLSLRISNIVNAIEILENTKAAQRISHSIKGSANLIGTKGIANLAHHLEDIFEYFAKLSIAPPQALADTMIEAADTIEVMIEFLQDLSPAPAESQRILQDVLDWANRIDRGDLSEPTPKIEIEEEKEKEIELNTYTDKTSKELNSEENTVVLDNQPQANLTQNDQEQLTNTALTSQTDLIRVPRETLNQIFNLIGETSIAITQIQEQLKRMHQRGNDMQIHDKNLNARRFELENLVSVRSLAATQKKLIAESGNQQFDSLEMDQYDEFYGATHSFIEAVSDNRESNRDILSHIIDLETLFQHQQRINRSLENIVVTTRMVTIKTIVPRLQRAVRQTCRATDKQATLKIVGEQLLMDGDVLNKLADPLMHLLRNAIDHGIESSQQRRELGKSETGNITLEFYQEGNSIRAKCSDDGAGLNYDQIRWIAMEQDLIDPQQEIDNDTLARVILNSGFSTRETATHISGRGVGMDVVYTAVLDLKGSIDISDNNPCGTIFNLRLPITLLTSHSILVQTQQHRYAIPTVMLEQILPAGTGQFKYDIDKPTFQYNNTHYQTKTLNQLLGLAESTTYATNKTNNDIILLVNYGSKTIAVTVERIISSYDLVVKNMGSYMKNVTGIAGIALLGDGGVVPVLDMVGLLDAAKTGHQIIRPSHSQVDKIVLSKVLIVDDSLSVRNSLSQLVQDAGFEPLLARDGLEALEIMKKTQPNLILTDLEMPRMTGLELTGHIRANEKNANLPIFMITSRTMAKHQSQAQKVGVNEYITKPFSEDDLIRKLGQALNG